MRISIVRSLRFFSLVLVLCIAMLLAGCANAQVTQEELTAKHYTDLQTLFMNTGDQWTADDFCTACKEAELFTFTQDGTVFASKRAMSTSPAGGSGLSYLEFYTDSATGTWGMLHYHSDFESADIYAYQSGRWLTPDMEATESQPIGSYIISQPDVTIDGDEIVGMTSGNATIDYIRFDTRQEAVDRLQNVHILLA